MEVLEDLADDGRVGDEREDSAAAAAGAEEDVEGVDALEERGPVETGGEGELGLVGGERCRSGVGLVFEASHAPDEPSCHRVRRVA